MQTNTARASFTTLTLVVTTALVASLTGCLSEAEKQARRDCALDVKGDYTEVRPDGTKAGSLHIDDETSKNDIQATFTRGALYDGEQAFIDRLANDADKTAVAASIVFGKGDDVVTDDLVGGQNISDDFGASDKVGVSAPAMTAVANQTGATDPKITYALALQIENGSDTLNGTLTVTFSETEKKATSSDTDLHSEPKSFDVSFKRASGVLQQDQSAECKADVDGK